MNAFIVLKKKWSSRGCLFAVLFSFGCVLGRSVYQTNSINGIVSSPTGFLSSIGFMVLIWMVTMTCYVFLSDLLQTRYRPIALSQTLRAFPCYLRPLLFILLIVEYLLVLAAYYPGVFSYDIILQTDQVLGLSPYSKFHPPLHTFIWGVCIRIFSMLSPTASTKGIIEGGITVYALFQSLLLAYLLSGIPFRLFDPDSKRGRVGSLLLSAFFLLNPLIWLFAVIPTKDALFAIFFTGTIYRLILVLRDNKNKLDRVLLATDLLLSMLLRNNAIYAFILATICMLFMIPKEKKSLKKKFSLLFLCSILASFLIQGPIYSLMGIQAGDRREALSLPFQQMAHIYMSERGNLSEEDLSILSYYFDLDGMPAAFNPRFADPVKNLVDLNAFVDKDFIEFLRDYTTLAVRYPDNCLNEFLALNVSSWYPLAIGPDPIAGRDYIETFIARYDPQPERTSYLPTLMNILDGISSFQALRNIPILNLLCSGSASIWILLLLLLLMSDSGQKTDRIVLYPSLFLWVTYLAGPVTCIRYIYPLMLVLPLQIFVLFFPLQKADITNKR